MTPRDIAKRAEWVKKLQAAEEKPEEKPVELAAVVEAPVTERRVPLKGK
jgi:hypothetical protein